MDIFNFDVETCSELDLKKVGGHVYTRHPSTDVLCVSWYNRTTKEKGTWYRGDPPPLHFLPHNSGIYTGWNVLNFDRLIWKFILAPKYGWVYPGDHAFRDTMEDGAYAGLPRGLDQAAQVSVGAGKDKEGSKLMMSLTKPRKITKTMKDPWRHHTASAIKRLGEYCEVDVLRELQIAKIIKPLPKYEGKISRASTGMNDRGIKIDKELAESAINILEIHRQNQRERLASITKGRITKETQHKAFVSEMLRYGIDLPKTDKGNERFDKEVVTDLLTQVEDWEPAYDVLSLRQELNKSSVSKYQAMLRCLCPDGRIRGCFQNYGAHTGRWAGRLVQFQNFPRGIFKSEEQYREAIALVKAGDYETLASDPSRNLMDVMSTLLRACIVPEEGCELNVSDYSAIEGRVLAWLAGETKVLHAYEKGERMYCHAASSIYRVPYQTIYDGRNTDKKYGEMDLIGKVCELALGYQGASGAFASMAKAYGVELPESRVKEIVRGWRDGREKTVQFWYDLESAAIKAINRPGTIHKVGKIKFRMKGKHLRVLLPSGRLLTYRDAHTRQVSVPWTDKLKEAMFYWGVDSYTGQWTRIQTYGGKLAENITQAVARDFMAEALVRCENTGLNPVLTIHDELGCENPIGSGGLEHLNNILMMLPSWAPDIPMGVAGWSGQFYRKD